MRGENLKWFAGVAVALAAVTLAMWLWRHRTTSAGLAPLSSEAAANNQVLQAGSSVATIVERSPLDAKLRGAAVDLVGAADAASRGQALARLRQVLAAGSTNEVSAAVRRLLDSKMDAPTGQGFRIGRHGVLSEAPTLRAFLLDHLGQIDPTTAAEYARVILNSKDSPDEWAVALRNLAWGDSGPEARALLAEKTGELLGYQPWQQNPSAGYLEAFDLAVYLGGKEFVPALAGLVSLQDNPAVAHAAFLSLDRLVIKDPDEVLTALLTQSQLLQGRDQTRADYFARANVGDVQQRALLEHYLLDPITSASELQQFAGVFPNANFMVSQNLVTPMPNPDSAALAARDAVSLQVVQQWLADPRFAQVRPQLQTIQVRLAEFVRQASTR